MSATHGNLTSQLQRHCGSLRRTPRAPRSSAWSPTKSTSGTIRARCRLISAQPARASWPHMGAPTKTPMAHVSRSTRLNSAHPPRASWPLELHPRPQLPCSHAMPASLRLATRVVSTPTVPHPLLIQFGS
eukprot:3129066-Pyramimonas_sp.AAC.1